MIKLTFERTIRLKRDSTVPKIYIVGIVIAIFYTCIQLASTERSHPLFILR